MSKKIKRKLKELSKRVDNLEKKLFSIEVNDPCIVKSNKVYNISDKVYMDSPFGRYRGEVKKVGDGVMTIESYSPIGKGFMLAEYDIDGTDWEKY